MRLAAIAFVLLLAALPGAACGGGGSDDAAQVDAAKTLAEARAAVERATSFHFKLSHENGATPLPILNLGLVSAEGDVAIPDRLAADVQAKAATLNVSVKVIGIGEQTWLTNPFNRRWESIPGSVRDLANPQGLLTAVVTSLQDVTFVENAEVGGEDTLHIRGSLDSGVLADSIPSARAGNVLGVDVWVGARDSLPRRARIAGRLSPDEAENIVRLLEFSRFNASVDIKAPQ